MGEVDTKLIELRRTLHRTAELAGTEAETATIVERFLADCKPDRTITGLGGHGLAAVFASKSPGPSVLIRAELDALPIPETLKLDYGSQQPQASHKCGHDGHMTIVAGLAPLLHNKRTDRGSVILLFQPAEEVGKGARRVIDDPAFAGIAPDHVFALHNLPGYRQGQVILREDVFAAASNGLIVELSGATSHAAEPAKGRSPALALAQLVESLSSVPQMFTSLHEAAKVTVIHARLGEVAFGTSPGNAVVMATLRAHSREVMEKLSRRCSKLAEDIAKSWELEVSVRWDEEFPVTVNDNSAVELVADAANALGLETYYESTPFGWSEDFGHFTSRYPGALFGLGAGIDQPALHHPDYDFPEELLGIGTGLFAEIVRRLLGWEITE